MDFRHLNQQSPRLRARRLLVLLLAVCWLAPLHAAGPKGTFATDTASGPLVLTLDQNAEGFSGLLEGAGQTMPLQGWLEGDSLVGLIQVGDATLPFLATLQEPQIHLDIHAVTAAGEPDPDNVTRFSLTRRGSGEREPDPSPPATTPPDAAGEDSTAGAAGAAGSGQSSLGLPLAPGVTEDHPLLAPWQAHFAGKKLTQFERYASSPGSGGYSAQREVTLCSNRTFVANADSSLSVDVGGAFGNASGASGGTGRWTLITNGQAVGLVLLFSDGGTMELPVTANGSETYVNGTRTFVTPAEICP